jgi:hypothetical protein
LRRYDSGMTANDVRERAKDYYQLERAKLAAQGTLSMTDKAHVLRQAAAAVAQCTVDIQRQRQIIAELERDGRDTTAAHSLLTTFLQTQARNEQDLARVMEELEQLN